MIELAQVVRKHGPQYLAKFGDRMPQNHKRALAAIAACRTEEMGGIWRNVIITSGEATTILTRGE